MRQEVAERYNQPLDWLLLVRRCGYGNLDAARQANFQTWGAPDSVAGSTLAGTVIAFHLVDGDDRRAASYMRQEFDQTFNPWDAVNLMVLDLHV